jgi:signal transduction histidine kinase
MNATTKPRDLDRIERETRDQFFGFFVWARLAAVPVIVAIAAWIAWGDAALWRRVAMGAVIAALVFISVWDVWLFSRFRFIGPWAIPRNVLGAGLATLVLVVSTGGLDSPFVPVLVIVALMTTVFVSPVLGRVVVVGLQIPAIWACAVVAVYRLVPDFVPAVFGGGPRACPDDVLLWTRAAVYSVALTAIISFGAHIRRAFAAMVTRVFVERDEQLRIWADQAKTLTTLSAEIAHELKNPLASVKGLAALVARHLDGKPAERMAVLRGEVERMQSILQEFLNFSRPLVPLSLQRTDLADLAREVVELHDGMARERRVEVSVVAAGVEALRSDPRKIKQVVINLLQNALEASPPGERIELEVSRAASGELVLGVRDHGPGLDASLADRAFDAGVTSKESGSGLGLTVARALARQHGGEIDLESPPGGGCLAVLRLPPEPPAELASTPGGGS